jgi:ABC-type lipopolysaccharide export system ATPase subunit
MIAGLEFPTMGSLKIHGVEVGTLPPNKRPVNTVFQSYSLFPHMSVEQNIAFGLKMRKVGKSEIGRRVGDAIQLVQLEGLESRRSTQLSGGQQQRVALARALVNSPEVLLLDEPLGALDLKLRQQMQRELKILQREVGITFVAHWRRDGTGRWLEEPVEGWDRPSVITPDDIMAGTMPTGPVIVFDDEHYYMGGVIAERLRRAGLDVTLVTPANEVSTWTTHTEEQHRIQQRILELGIVVETGTSLAGVGDASASLECIYTGRVRETRAAGIVMTTARTPHDPLYDTLVGRIDVQRIGDCLAPGTIATAVYSGHQYARELDAGAPADVRFRRERPVIPQ